MSLIAIVLVVVVLVVIGLAVVLAVVLARGRSEQKQLRRDRAEQLRRKAAAQDAGVSESAWAADEAEATAERLRAETARAEQRATELREAARMDQARREDAVRAADRVDPDVDHAADDYQPGRPPPGVHREGKENDSTGETRR